MADKKRIEVTEQVARKIYDLRMQKVTTEAIGKQLDIPQASVRYVTTVFRKNGVKFPSLPRGNQGKTDLVVKSVLQKIK